MGFGKRMADAAGAKDTVSFLENELVIRDDVIKGNDEKLTKMERAIYMHCYECSGHVKVEIERCVIEACPLYNFRLEGK